MALYAALLYQPADQYFMKPGDAAGQQVRPTIRKAQAYRGTISGNH